MPKRTALVIRATGAQGRGVTRHLIQGGWRVHALVKDAEEPRAVLLRDLGAVLCTGTLGDYDSVRNAIEGCDSVFLNQMPSFVDDAETREASILLDIAKKVGVRHIVHSTTLPLGDENIREKLSAPLLAPLAAAIIGKGDVEELVRASGIAWTIIRPGWFMSNLTIPVVNFMFPELAEGRLVNYYGHDCTLPLIDPEDIGAFVLAAFEQPSRFEKRIIRLAAEKLSVEQITNHISRETGKAVVPVYRSVDQLGEDSVNPLVLGQLNTRGMDKYVDLNKAKGWGIPLTLFQDFLKKNQRSLVP